MTNKEVMQLALDVLEDVDGIDTETECVTIDVGEAIEALRTALAQPESDEVLAEREACAVIAFNAKTYLEAAAAIRARGQE